MSTLKDIPSESIVLTLSFLRATDLASVREVDKTIFCARRIHDSIILLLKEVYNFPLPSNPKRSMSNSSATEEVLLRPDFLYVKEISSILFVLSAPQPALGKGYWISTTWLGNAKKYMEALQLPDLDVKKKSASKKKQSRIRARRGSDSLPPWPAINSEIICEHGGLSIAGRGVKGRRRAIASRYWHFLRRFYPDGPQFKCTHHGDCAECASHLAEAKATAAEKRDAEKSTRRNDLVPPILTALLLRKCGVPLDCVTSRVADFMEITETPVQSLHHQLSPQVSSSHLNQLTGAEVHTVGGIHESPSENSLGMYLAESIFPKSDRKSESSSSPTLNRFDDVTTPIRSPVPHEFTAYRTPDGTEDNSVLPESSLTFDGNVGYDISDSGILESSLSSSAQPLLAGHYNLVPRKWLKAWRRYVKDPSVTTLPMLNCSSLLCAEHRQIVIPPHLQEYLLGIRRTLLSGLGLYPGEVVEILSADEWDALQNALPCQTVSDRSIRFCLDGENIFWNMGVCLSCDPFNLDPSSKKKPKTSRNSQLNSPDLLLDGDRGDYC